MPPFSDLGDAAESNIFPVREYIAAALCLATTGRTASAASAKIFMRERYEDGLRVIDRALFFKVRVAMELLPIRKGKEG